MRDLSVLRFIAGLSAVAMTLGQAAFADSGKGAIPPLHPVSPVQAAKAAVAPPLHPVFVIGKAVLPLLHPVWDGREVKVAVIPPLHPVSVPGSKASASNTLAVAEN
ncbi:MAG: hypothetical protein ORN49_09555 [Rhodobacteraceae bacterium]|nr:hypothetical protein [Paracoccaceae bacterium]